MKKNYSIFILILGSILSFAAISMADLDTAYVKAFGWSSICVSNSGFPQKANYDASQFDFHDGKFFVNAGGTINLRSILPQGKIYSDLLKNFNEKHKEFKKMTEEQVYWKIYSSHDQVGNRLFGKWPGDPSQMLHQNKPLCFIQFKTPSDLRSWNSSGVNWDDTENNDMQRDVGNWLSVAKPGWQLYILHTVGFRRNCPEDKYWDATQGKEIIPISFEMAKPFAYCIIEVK